MLAREGPAAANHTVMITYEQRVAGIQPTFASERGTVIQLLLPCANYLPLPPPSPACCTRFGLRLLTSCQRRLVHVHVVLFLWHWHAGFICVDRYLLISFFPLINRIQNASSPDEPVFALYLIHSIMSPLQGFLNAGLVTHTAAPTHIHTHTHTHARTRTQDPPPGGVPAAAATMCAGGCCALLGMLNPCIALASVFCGGVRAAPQDLPASCHA